MRSAVTTLLLCLIAGCIPVTPRVEESWSLEASSEEVRIHALEVDAEVSFRGDLADISVYRHLGCERREVATFRGTRTSSGEVQQRFVPIWQGVGVGGLLFGGASATTLALRPEPEVPKYSFAAASLFVAGAAFVDLAIAKRRERPQLTDLGDDVRIGEWGPITPCGTEPISAANLVVSSVTFEEGAYSPIATGVTDGEGRFQFNVARFSQWWITDATHMLMSPFRVGLTLPSGTVQEIELGDAFITAYGDEREAHHLTQASRSLESAAANLDALDFESADEALREAGGFLLETGRVESSRSRHRELSNLHGSLRARSRELRESTCARQIPAAEWAEAFAHADSTIQEEYPPLALTGDDIREQVFEITQSFERQALALYGAVRCESGGAIYGNGMVYFGHPYNGPPLPDCAENDDFDAANRAEEHLDAWRRAARDLLQLAEGLDFGESMSHDYAVDALDDMSTISVLRSWRFDALESQLESFAPDPALVGRAFTERTIARAFVEMADTGRLSAPKNGLEVGFVQHLRDARVHAESGEATSHFVDALEETFSLECLERAGSNWARQTSP